jgi:hypothetical protein
MRVRPRSAAAHAAVLAVALAALAGCGYKPVRYRSALPGVETLAIGPLANDTYEPGVEAVVLDALRREALARGGLRLVDDPEAADLVLSGAVRRLAVSPRSFSSVVLSLEYEVYMGLELKVRRRGGRPIVIDPRAQNESEIYLASADLEALRKNRREAIQRLAGVLADRVWDSVYEAPSAEPAAAEPAAP